MKNRIVFRLAIGLVAILGVIRMNLESRRSISPDELGAVSGLRNINVDERDYAARHPDLGFTCDLKLLGRQGAISSLYQMSLSNCSTVKGKVVAYRSDAIPNSFFEHPYFCSDESGMIKYGNEKENCTTLIETRSKVN